MWSALLACVESVGRGEPHLGGKTSPRRAIGFGLCGIIAATILAKHFYGPAAKQPIASPRLAASAHERNSETGRLISPRAAGWIAQRAGDEASVVHEGSGAATGAPAESSGGTARANYAAIRFGHVAEFQAGKGADPVDPVAADSDPAQATQGASLGGSGNVPPLPRGSSAPPQVEEAPVELVQPAGGSTVVFANARNTDLPTDKDFRIDDAARVIGRQAGGLSFWLTPQWEAGDTGGGTLVRLGNDELQGNSFAIVKEGQSLRFIFTDSSGSGIDSNTAIDGWRPDQRHLITATWGQGPDGNSLVSLYVDGTTIAERPYSGAFEVGEDVPLHIGADVETGKSLPGVFSNFQLYNRRLAAAELEQVQENGGRTE